MVIYSAEIHSVYFDSNDIPRIGEWIMTVNETETAAAILSDYFDFGDISIRKSDSLIYISSKDGPGYIPILTFHKLGSDYDFELEPSLFKKLLLFLNDNGFYAIKDSQYLSEDYSYVENGKKLIVLGSDDASTGTITYETIGDENTSSFIMESGSYIISDDSMVYYLDRYLPKENGHGNFTFYVTFDAIPFRQTGGGYNPGSPYEGMYAVLSKLQYLEKYYFLGNHTANHYYSEELSEQDFHQELFQFYKIMDSYGMDTDSIKTLAYSYGIGDITSEREETVKSFRYKGSVIEGAFDYNGFFAKPLSEGIDNPFDVSRIGVDNKSIDKIMALLKNVPIFKSRRIVLYENNEFIFNLSSIKFNRSDLNFIIIRN